MRGSIAVALSFIISPTLVSGDTFEGYTVVNSVKSGYDVETFKDVSYSCSLTSLWTAANFPDSYPADAKFSKPLGVSHQNDFSFWSPGKLVSPGMGSYIETGSTNNIILEIVSSEISPRDLKLGDEMFADTGSETEEIHHTTIPDLSLNYTSNEVRISTIAKLYPSSDWFTGFYDYSAVDEETNSWLLEFEIESCPFDGGVEKTNIINKYAMANEAEEKSRPVSILSERPVSKWYCALQRDTLPELPTPDEEDNELVVSSITGAQTTTQEMSNNTRSTSITSLVVMIAASALIVLTLAAMFIRNAFSS